MSSPNPFYIADTLQEILAYLPADCSGRSYREVSLGWMAALDVAERKHHKDCRLRWVSTFDFSRAYRNTLRLMRDTHALKYALSRNLVPVERKCAELVRHDPAKMPLESILALFRAIPRGGRVLLRARSRLHIFFASRLAEILLDHGLVDGRVVIDWYIIRTTIDTVAELEKWKPIWAASPDRIGILTRLVVRTREEDYLELQAHILKHYLPRNTVVTNKDAFTPWGAATATVQEILELHWTPLERVRLYAAIGII